MSNSSDCRRDWIKGTHNPGGESCTITSTSTSPSLTERTERLPDVRQPELAITMIIVLRERLLNKRIVGSSPLTSSSSFPIDPNLVTETFEEKKVRID